MKAESNIKPNPVTIEPHGTDTDIVLTENVTEIKTEDGIKYTYDSYRLTVRDRPGLQASVEADLTAWLALAKSKEAEAPEPTIPEHIGAVETTTGEIVTVLADIMEVTI